jgi:hypothetical protein
MKRAVVVALAAGLVLAAVDVTLLRTTSSAPPTSSSTLSRVPSARGGTALSPAAGQSAGNAGTTGPGSSAGRSGTDRSAGTADRAGEALGPSQVSVAEAAALPSANVHPGYASPDDAVDGFYHALLGGTPTQACAYVTTPCPSFGSGRITGMVSILDTVSDGGEALVEVSGTICRGATCVPLVDRLEMPAGPASFSTSWTSLISGVYGWAASPLPCVRDTATGRWLVKLS